MRCVALTPRLGHSDGRSNVMCKGKSLNVRVSPHRDCRIAVAGLTVLAVIAGHAAGKELRPVERGVAVTPLKVASVRIEGGQPIFGPWQEYRAPVAGCYGAEHFDAFDPDQTGAPEDEDGCGLGGTRWFFGPSYCTGGAVNDLVTSVAGAQSTHTNFAWYWTCGQTRTERCIIVVVTGEDFSEDCEGFGKALPGVAYDFGELACNPGSYYYSNVDLTESGLFHTMPLDGAGWYQVQYFRGVSGEPATCAQPILWGTSVHRPGAQGPTQYNDDNPRDGIFQVPQECYAYAFGLCPDPLGAMHSFGDGGNDCTLPPEIPCDDVKKFKANCRQDSGKLKILVVMTDERHDGEVVSVAAGPYWLDLLVRGQRAKHIDTGWIGEPQITLIRPEECFAPKDVVCKAAAGKKMCSHEITGLAVANNCDDGAAGGCPDRRGDVFCPESGKECVADADCTGRVDVVIACSNDTGNPKKKFCKYPSKRLACDCN